MDILRRTGSLLCRSSESTFPRNKPTEQYTMLGLGLRTQMTSSLTNHNLRREFSDACLIS